MATPMRAVYDNAADRGTTSVSGTSVLPVGNLKTNSKNEVWRSSAGTLSVTFTTTFATPETIGCAVLPFSNFSSSSTMRVRLYSDMACTSQLLDSGVVNCSQGGGARVQGLTAAQSASAYQYGGGCTAVVWFAPTANVQGILIDVVDTSNLQGYLESARLLIAPYWEANYQAEYGATVEMADNTGNYRTDAGNLLSDVGTRHKTLSFVLSFMTPSDRANLWKLVKYVGLSQPLFVSLYPASTDKGLEQEHMVFGKLTKTSVIASSQYNVYSAPVEVESL